MNNKYLYLRPLHIVAMGFLLFALFLTPIRTAHGQGADATLVGIGQGDIFFSRYYNTAVFGGIIQMNVDGFIVDTYCIDLYAPIGFGDILLINGPLTDLRDDVDWCAVNYILNNYDGNSTLEAGAIQCAVWYIVSEPLGPYDGLGGQYQFMTDPVDNPSNYDAYSFNNGTLLRDRAFEILADIPVSQAGDCLARFPEVIDLQPNEVFVPDCSRQDVVMTATVYDQVGEAMPGQIVHIVTQEGQLTPLPSPEDDDDSSSSDSSDSNSSDSNSSHSEDSGSNDSASSDSNDSNSNDSASSDSNDSNSNDSVSSDSDSSNSDDDSSEGPSNPLPVDPCEGWVPGVVETTAITDDQGQVHFLFSACGLGEVPAVQVWVEGDYGTLFFDELGQLQPLTTLSLEPFSISDESLVVCKDRIVPEGAVGCSHGYWKNHVGAWQFYFPEERLVDVFGVPASLGLAASDTLLDGLYYHGGNGLQGAARNLLKQAVASLLNAVHPDVAFPFTEIDVLTSVNNALNSMDRHVMLDLADVLDEANNLGCSDDDSSSNDDDSSSSDD